VENLPLHPRYARPGTDGTPRPSCCREGSAHLADERQSREGTAIMAKLAEQVPGERQARMVQSMIAEPDDSATGRVLGRVGGVETLRLIEDDRAAVPGMNRADALAWRDRLTAATRPEVLVNRVRQAEAAGIGTVIPADTSWPGSLDVLGARAPYVLWTRGADSFLSRPLLDFVSIVGSRAS